MCKFYNTSSTYVICTEFVLGMQVIFDEVISVEFGAFRRRNDTLP